MCWYKFSKILCIDFDLVNALEHRLLRTCFRPTATANGAAVSGSRR